MLRQSTAPLALCVLFLASCNAAGDDPLAAVPVPPSGQVVPDPIPDDPTPADDPDAEDPDAEDPVSLALSMSPAPASEAPKKSTNYYTLAKIYENMPWARTLIASDSQGGTVRLELQDDGNGDADAFNFDTETGEFSLLEMQDFERPGDADADNFYELKLVAIDLPGPNNSIPFNIAIADRAEVFDDFPVVWLNGDTELGGLGLNVTSLGDIDNDGRPDLAVAAPGRHSRQRYTDLPPTDYHPEGDAYLVSGKILSETNFLNVDETESSGFGHIAGTADDLNVGYNMILVSDLDEDEIDDFVVQRDESTLEIILGATMLSHMNTGGNSALADLSSGTIKLPEGQIIDPTTFAQLGDLNEDGLTDLALCAHQTKSSSDVEVHVFALSGAGLRDALSADGTRSISDLYDQKQAAYYAYDGNHRTCGPLTALGDVNNDGLVDITIPMPGPLATDAGILVFGGAEMLDMMNAGGRHKVTPFDRFFNGAVEPYTHFTDEGVTGLNQDYMVMALGDVTGDGMDDFSFGWVSYTTRQDDSAYIVKGGEALLEPGSSKDIRAMIGSGRAIQLAATSDVIEPGQDRQEPVFALQAPEDGLHSTLIFVGSEVTGGNDHISYSVTANELPNGGTAIVNLPIAGAGHFKIPRGYGRLLSYVKSIGDLNNDGYGDLAIGWGNADFHRIDAGRLLLVSGKEIIEARARGENLEPSTLVPTSQ